MAVRSDQVLWPKPLHDMWEQIFACTDCQSDPQLAGKLPWHQYVPLKTIGILPPGTARATYLVAAAEPSGAPRIKDRAASIARQRTVPGVRNLNGTRGDLTLQFALERWLLRQGESYYLTDLGKCRVPVGKTAAATAERRYANCSHWFEQELATVDPLAIIAVGRPAFKGAMQMRRRDWPAVFEISHWGDAGVRYWKEYLSSDWDDGLPATTALDAFARERWTLSSHKESVEQEIGTYPPMYRWLLAAYRFELGAIREILEKAPIAAAGERAVTLPGPRKMRVLYPLAKS